MRFYVSTTKKGAYSVVDSNNGKAVAGPYVDRLTAEEQIAAANAASARYEIATWLPANTGLRMEPQPDRAGAYLAGNERALGGGPEKG